MVSFKLVIVLLTAINFCFAYKRARRVFATTPIVQNTNMSEESYEADNWLEIDNRSVETMVSAWLGVLIVIIIIGTCILYFIRRHYRKLTEAKLDAIRRECERLRDAQNTIPQKGPLPEVSPAVTDQVVYYPLGEMLKEDARGGFL